MVVKKVFLGSLIVGCLCVSAFADDETEKKAVKTQSLTTSASFDPEAAQQLAKQCDAIFEARKQELATSLLQLQQQQSTLQILTTENTKLLKEKGLIDRARLILDGHEHMERYVEKESVDAICFNFGYLPGGNHKIATSPKTSVRAIEQGLALLKSGGMMSLCIYSGGDTGFEEKEKILTFLKKISSKLYTVILNEYYNRENNPPMPVFVFKN